jgi:hypothetical protein
LTVDFRRTGCATLRRVLRSWFNFLPVFVVRYFAKRRCEVLSLGDMNFVQALPGVLFALPSGAADV